MSREIPPPLALALLILLRRAGWSQEEIAAKLKVKPETVSGWIRNGRGLDRARLEEIAVVLGFKESEIDRTLDYLAGKQPAEVEEIPGYTGLTPDERQIVQEARARVQQQAVAELDAALPQHIQSSRVRRARAKAEEVWNELRPRSAEERRVYLDENPEVCTPALVRRLCDESKRGAARSAVLAMALAEMALYVAERVPGEVSLRCQAYAQGLIANANRVGGQPPVADLAYAKALAIWEKSPVSDPNLDEAHFLDLGASLRRDQRRLNEALGFINRALTLTQPEGLSDLLLNKSHVQHASGQYEEALQTLDQASSLIDPKKAPQSWFAVQFNRTANLCRLGRFQQAQELLPLLWDLAASLKGDLHILRLRWLAAEISAGVGDEDLAARALQDVRKDFADLKNPIDAALVSLDLSKIYIRQERWREVRLVAEEMLQLFRDLGVHREAIASLLLFREAAEREEATVDLIQRLARYLREAERDPSHHFEG
jgi:tetratricopeptide (TPR) repeat protein